MNFARQIDYLKLKNKLRLYAIHEALSMCIGVCKSRRAEDHCIIVAMSYWAF